MRLDWNDIRARAAHFAEEWKDAHYESGQTQTFYNEFFELFGVVRRRVASFEHGVNLPANKRGYLDLFWKGKLLVEQKSRGRDLKPARRQALDYFPGLKEYELPRYILLSDFQSFELYDLDVDPDKPVSFKLSELPDHVEAFGFIVGQERRIFRDQDPANIKASEMMGELHDSLEAAGYTGHALERFLVRILFCLFADDTGIFQPLGIFEDYVKNTREDGADLGAALAHLFQVLNTERTKRQKTITEELDSFDYINGDLFEEVLPLPHFNREMRDKLIEVCGFRWQEISPAIFGSLFQSVMDKDERRRRGGHYTSEKNILKVIEPLFLDDLRVELNRLKERRDTNRTSALKEFLEKISKITCFDPACGCGNFLVVAYRELRELEIEALQQIRSGDRLDLFDAASLAQVNVHQFFGIEIEEFPSRIAEVAMWMTDHIMNMKLSLAFGKSFVRIPLTTSPNIRCADALEVDWNTLLPAESCTYLFGNPPFGGSKFQDEKQRAQVRRIAALGGSGGSLDYVAPWFIKGAQYLRSSSARMAFVATNSITQGEQVAQLWPILFKRYALEISFAHRSFKWFSDARGAAKVHCVIIGLDRAEAVPTDKRLFTYADPAGDPIESRHKWLSPYLIDASRLSNRHLVVKERPTPLSAISPTMNTGTQPIDNGNYIFSAEERLDFLREEPRAESFFRPFIGTEEFINAEERWILFLRDAAPQQVRAMPKVVERIELVRSFRKKSKRKSTLRIADYPTKLNVETIPQSEFLVVPEVSSEERNYIPIGWLSPPTIPSNKLRLIERAQLWHFAILTSRMHMAWTQIVGGRLESRYQYSVGINFNAYVWPENLDEETRKKIEVLASAILSARKLHASSSFADLYDPSSMPPNLLKAHTALDAAVDRLYRKTPFVDDRERVEFMFSLYEQQSVAPELFEDPASNAKRRKRGKAPKLV